MTFKTSHSDGAAQAASSQNPHFDQSMIRALGQAYQELGASFTGAPFGREPVKYVVPTAGATERLEHARNSLTPKKVAELLQPTTSEATLEAMRHSIRGRIAAGGVMSDEISHILADLDNFDASKLREISGTIAQLIADAAIEAAHTAEEAAHTAHEQVMAAWHALEEKQTKLDEAMAEANRRWHEGDHVHGIDDDTYAEYQRRSAAARVAAADAMAHPDDAAKAQRAQTTAAAVTTHVDGVVAEHPDALPEVQTANSGYRQAQEDLAAARQREAEAQRQREEARQREAEARQREAEARQREAANADLFGPSPAPTPASAQQPEPAMAANEPSPAPVAAASTPAAPAVADVSEGETGTMASPPRPAPITQSPAPTGHAPRR